MSTNDNPSMADEMVELLRDAGRRLGRELNEDGLENVRAYAAERMLHLSTFVGEDGYYAALIAERDNVALRAGIEITEAADAADYEFLGIIGGVLGTAARALVA